MIKIKLKQFSQYKLIPRNNRLKFIVYKRLSMTHRQLIVIIKTWWLNHKIKWPTQQQLSTDMQTTRMFEVQQRHLSSWLALQLRIKRSHNTELVCWISQLLQNSPPWTRTHRWFSPKINRRKHPIRRLEGQWRNQFQVRCIHHWISFHSQQANFINPNITVRKIVSQAHWLSWMIVHHTWKNKQTIILNRILLKYRIYYNYIILSYTRYILPAHDRVQLHYRQNKVVMD